MSRLVIIPLLIAVFAGLAPSGMAQNKLDLELRSALEAIESRAKAGVNDEDDAKKRAAIQQQQTDLTRFIALYSPRERELTHGRFELAKAYIYTLQPKMALSHLEYFAQTFPKAENAPTARLFLADVYRSTSRYADALKVYQAFIRDYPKADTLPYARLGIATTQFLNLDFDGAAKSYRAVMTLHAEHSHAADAALQLANALMYGGHFEEARKHIQSLQETSADAPELKAKAAMAKLLGQAAPELENVLGWSGTQGTTIKRQRGRVLVLCFFMVKSRPSIRTLQYLSKLEAEFRGRGMSVWGLSKAYLVGKGRWDVPKELKRLKRFRENPKAVLERESALGEGDQGDAALTTPISVSLGLTKGFNNHRKYAVRRVPCVVVIDKLGMVRFIEELGQAEGGFQDRLLRRTLNKLSAE